MRGIRAFVQSNWRGGHRLILVRDQAARGKVDVLSGFTWETYEEGGCFDQNSGVGDADEMIQKILDRAWEVGFRPTGFSDVKNETAALREHLSDMKAIALHQLKIK